MSNSIRYPAQPAFWVCLLSLFLNTAFATPSHLSGFPDPYGRSMRVPAAGKGPFAAPVFADPVPADVTVDCLADVPPPVSLTATDDDDPSFPKTVAPVDSPDPASMNPCAGGTITRTWTATDMGGSSTTVSQIITVLPDNTPPVIDYEPVNDIVSCALSKPDAPVNSLRYDIWINSLRLAVATHLTDDCAGLDNLIDNAPASFTNDCGTLTVTFTAFDNCGLTTTYTASYTTIDTVPPVLIGLPANAVVSCADPIGDPPVVTAMDNCTDGMLEVTFAETSTRIADGTCSEYEYAILRTWTATDSCGNTTSHTQTIQVEDDMAPAFTVPADISISCGQDPTDLAITGNVHDLEDNCTPSDSISVTFNDTPNPGNCPGEIIITRVWRARDRCGNVTGKIQTITVTDDEAPTFTVPAEVTVDCRDANNQDITGRPTNIADNCDENPVVSFSDLLITGPCLFTYTIRRTWQVRDVCGNFTELDQIIRVQDLQAPAFSAQAADFVMSCNEEIDINTAFQQWVDSRGGANAVDNCSDAADLVWTVFVEGTQDAPFLPPLNCPSENGILQRQTLAFIVTDECGNRDTTVATFSVVDNTPPVVRNCSGDFTVSTDPGSCDALVTLPAPLIEEDCGFGQLAESLSGTAPVTSQAVPGQESSTPVDPVEITLVVTSLPVNALAAGTLTIDLTGVDGEEPTEFFNILGEDGSLLGTTNATGGQCGNSSTMLAVSVEQINEWAADGQIRIRLTPNIPQGQDGRFAVNAICQPTGTVTATLDFDRRDLGVIGYAYRIDEGARNPLAAVGPAPVTLSQGSHLVTLYASDCAGNEDSCSFTVTVVDTEPPVWDCPSDVTLTLAADSCQAAYTLPLPAGVADNCAALRTLSQTLPADTSGAYLSFSYDPNLNSYLADGKTLQFANVAADAMSPVSLTLDLRGDFNSTGAFIRVFGEDDSLIGSTAPGVASCASAGQQTFSIAAAAFNQWAADGNVQIRLEPNPIPVPPGMPGDGISPCDVAVVDADGETDSVSYVFVTLSYDALPGMFSYYAGGATGIPATPATLPGINPVLNFNFGQTEVFYTIPDLAGNFDTCSFTVTVEDPILPVARCKTLGALPINPSGLQVEVFDVSDVDAGSTDNCMIDTMFITPNTFTCADAGSPRTILLTVVDQAGNSSACSTTLGITLEEPEPSFNYGLCGGDTLYLFANPPAPGPGAYTYRWFRAGNNALISTQQNPIIPNVDPTFSDFYIVEIKGIFNGCTSQASVFVEIDPLPLQPTLDTRPVVCREEEIVLRFPGNLPDGDVVTFRWYEGLPPGGTFLGATSNPAFVIAGPHPLGVRNYYLTVEADGCLSPPSQSMAVSSVQRPVAMATFSDTTACAESIIQLGTFVSGPNVTDYQWTGPNNFSSSEQFPSVGPLNSSRSGYYYLRLFNQGCVSNLDSVLVNVKPKPARPAIAANGPICEGQTLVLTTATTGVSAYQWTHNGATYSSSVPSWSVPNADAGDGGAWTVFVTKNGCDSDPSAPVTAVVNATPNATADANPEQVCVGTPLQLLGGSDVPATFKWTGPGIQPRFNQNPLINTVTNANQGLYTLEVTSQPGCRDTASVFVTVLPGISNVDITDNAPSCLNGPTNIQLTPATFPPDNGSFTYIWRKGQETISTQKILTIPNATAASSGNYTLEVFTGSGCSSGLTTYTLELKNAPAKPLAPVAQNNRTAFCAGEMIILSTNDYGELYNEVTYYWARNGNPVAQTDEPELLLEEAGPEDGGNYSVFVIGDGCSSTVSAALQVTVNPIPAITASSNSAVCRGDQLQLFAESALGATYAWGGPGFFSSSLQNPAFNSQNQSMEFGTYYVVSTLNGCKSDTAFVEVRVKPRPRLPVALSSGPLCISSPGAMLTLSVAPNSLTAGAAYTWFLNNGNDPVSEPLTDPTYTISNFTGFSNGTYAFQVQAELDGCFSGLSVPVSVPLNTIPVNQAYAGPDTTICFNDHRLNATPPTIGTGFWTLAGGNPDGIVIANPDQPSTPVSGLTIEGGPYAFRWTLSNGVCVNYAFDTVRVTVTTGEQAYAGEDILACADEIINLSALPTAGPTAIGVWSQPSAQDSLGVVIVDTLNATTTIQGLEPDNIYVFTWTVSSECGTDDDRVQVIISDPDPRAGPDEIACNDEAAWQLNALVPTAGSRGRWSSPDPGVSIEFPTRPATNVSGLKPGENLFIWTIDEAFCGDAARDTVVIFYKVPPVANADQFAVDFQKPAQVDFLANDQVPPGTTVRIASGPFRGEIAAQAGGAFLYTPPFNFVGTDPLTYEVISEGCPTVSGQAVFVVGDGATCQVPTIITPNNDGINDNFVIPCLLDTNDFPNSQVLIFNRWGDEVYRSGRPYRNDWDGRFNGEDLPVDTYFYIIDFGNGQEKQSGFVMIQR